MTRRLCSVEGCGRLYFSRSYCAAHYARLRRGRPLDAPIRTVSYYRPPICTVDGCDKPHSAMGYCSRHYERVRATGSPFVTVKPPYDDAPPTPHEQMTWRDWHRGARRDVPMQAVSHLHDVDWANTVERNMHTRRETGVADCLPEDDYSLHVAAWLSGALTDVIDLAAD